MLFNVTLKSKGIPIAKTYTILTNDDITFHESFRKDFRRCIAQMFQRDFMKRKSRIHIIILIQAFKWKLV